MEDFAEEDESEDYIQDEAIMPASLRPPAHGQTEDPWGGFVLLDLTAYMADRRNATTATCKMRDGKGVIHVTFCTAGPPLVSYFCVHCTGGLKLSELALEPEIIATEGSLVLLRVALGEVMNSMEPDISEYFIYRAGAEGPSLTQLPHPGPIVLPQHPHVAIVRYCRKPRHDCSHCNYTIASLYRGADGPPESFYLCLYRSDTMTWSRETIPDKEVPNSCLFTSKTITIGGKRGTVGWVDLLQGIVFCDVLADTRQHTLHYVPIPSLLAEREDLSCPAADIAVVNGFISYIEMKVRVVPGSCSRYGAYTSDGWVAVKWTMKITDSLSDPWHLDCQLDSSEISDALPKLLVDADTPQPTLQTLHIGQPTLSLLENGVVYFLAKIDHRDQDRKAWVLAVDMETNKIQGVDEFGAERTLGLGPTFIASRVSAYL